MFFSENENQMVMCTWKAVHAIVTQLSDPGSQLFFSNIRTVSNFRGKGLVVAPFNPADFCLQIQSTQKKYSLDPINRSREMCHGLVSRCISFIRTNYKCCAIAVSLTLKKKCNTQLERRASQKILTCQYYLIKALLKNGFNMLSVNGIFFYCLCMLTSTFSRY